MVKKCLGTIGLHVFLFIVFAFMVLPFLWLIISSFRPNSDLFTNPFDIPENLSFDNYKAVFASHPILLYFFNSVMVATITTILDVIIAVLAAYAFMHNFKISKAVALILSIGLFIPTNAFLVPYYQMINGIGLYDNILGIALVYSGINLPMSFMVIKGYMDTIPKEILDSADIDGASQNQVLTRIVIPMSVPGIVTACVFLVINSWNELLFANLLNNGDKSRTIQVAIRSFLTTFEANYAHAFAAMVIAILPTIIVYALLTERIIGGMTVGAVKG